MLDLVFYNSIAGKKYNSKFFEKVLGGAIKELKLAGKKIEVSINLVGETKIRELNKKYRGKNKVTDVLSFPMRSNGSHRPEGVKRFEGPFDYAQGKSNAYAFDLGDIFICLSFAKKQAKSENVSIGYKLAQLTVHGFLHLLGYDHPDDKVSGPRLKRRGEKMFKSENKILKKCQDKGQFAG